jgi:hydroxyacylglutathione hydrolase
MLRVELLPLLSDNYAYLLLDETTGTSAVVDPAEARPVAAALEERGRKLDVILCTHHHGDHIGGNGELKKRYGCRIVGAEADRRRIPGMDQGVREGDTVEIGETLFRVLETPGHTSGHISFHAPEAEALFCGDTLFALGCGKLLEGDAATMWRSLSKLAALPEATRVYCGHEYTASNARFACSVDDDATLAARAADVERTRAAGKPTIPSTLGEEKRTNPFLRVAGPAYRERLGLGGLDAAAAFGELRRRKDNFR